MTDWADEEARKYGPPSVFNQSEAIAAALRAAMEMGRAAAEAERDALRAEIDTLKTDSERIQLWFRETIAERNAMIDKLRLDRDRGLGRISELEIELADARAEMREERDDYRMKLKRLEEEQDRQYEENQLDRAARDAAFDALLREKNIDKGDASA